MLRSRIFLNCAVAAATLIASSVHAQAQSGAAAKPTQSVPAQENRGAVPPAATSAGTPAANAAAPAAPPVAAPVPAQSLAPKAATITAPSPNSKHPLGPNEPEWKKLVYDPDFADDPMAKPEYYNEVKPIKAVEMLIKIAPKQALLLSANMYYDIYVKAYLEKTNRQAGFFPADTKEKFLAEMEVVLKSYLENHAEAQDRRVLFVCFYVAMSRIRRDVERQKLADFEGKVKNGEAAPISPEQRIAIQKEIAAREVHVSTRVSSPIYFLKRYWVGLLILLALVGAGIAWLAKRSGN